MHQNSSYYIYIVLSRTQTGFARTLKTVGHLQYNHSAISLDKDLKELYSFARPEQYGWLTARLVHETTDRYLVNATDIPIKVYRIPVTKAQHDWVRSTIYTIRDDPHYRYNLLSVLTYPIFGGFSTYKAFSCSEFVAFVLKHLGIQIRKPFHRYRPDDLQPLLEEYLCYDGKLLGFSEVRTTSEDYFQPFTMQLLNASVLAALVLLRRVIPVIFHVRSRFAKPVIIECEKQGMQ